MRSNLGAGSLQKRESRGFEAFLLELGRFVEPLILFVDIRVTIELDYCEDQDGKWDLRIDTGNLIKNNEGCCEKVTEQPDEF